MSIVVAPIVIGRQRGTLALPDACFQASAWWAPLFLGSNLERWLTRSSAPASGSRWLTPLTASYQEAVVKHVLNVDVAKDVPDDDLLEGLGLDDEVEAAPARSCADQSQLLAAWEAINSRGEELTMTFSHADCGSISVRLRAGECNVMWVLVSEATLTTLERAASHISDSDGATTDASETSPGSALVSCEDSPSSPPCTFSAPVHSYHNAVQWRAQRKAFMVRIKAGGKWLTKSFKPRSEKDEDKSEAEALAWAWLNSLCRV